LTFAVALAASCPASGAATSDWPQWRGPARNGVTPEHSGWPQGWPPKRLWGKNVGLGCTSPILAGGRIYVMGWHGRPDRRRNPVGSDVVYCIDALTGKEVWKQTYRSRYQPRTRAGDLGQYGGPNSTPAFDPQTQRLYTLSSDGDFRCWDTARKGKRLWSMNLHDKYRVKRRPNVGGGVRDFGFTSSPLILGDRVVVEVGADNGTVIAFDKKTGAEGWRSALKGAAGHTSGPVTLTVDGTPCLATLTLRKLVVMRLDKGHEGRTIAEYPRQTDCGCNLAAPAVSGSAVVLTSAYNRKSTSLIEISPTGARRKWRARDYSLVCTPVIHKGLVFTVDRWAKCLDLATGKLKWRGGSFSHGSCLATGDDKVIVFGRGRLVLLDPAKNRYHELGRVNGIVRDACYPHILLANGIICCKDKSGNIVCFSVRR